MLRQSPFILVFLLFASAAFAVEQQPAEPIPPPPPNQTAPPVAAQASASDDLNNDEGDLSDLGQSQNGYLSNNVAVAGTGLASASATGGGVDAGPVTNAAILPGQFTAATIQSAMPVDQIFSSYSYYNRFQVVSTTFTPTLSEHPTFAPTTTRGPGFNLSIDDIGFEKTIFGGIGSVYCDAPFLQATDNITGANPDVIDPHAKIDGVGDVTFGFKFLLLYDQHSGNALSAGVSVAAPTGHAGQVVTSETVISNGASPPSPMFTVLTVVKVNPTYVQPWVAGAVNWDRFSLQEYFGVLAPADHDVVTAINNDVTLSYNSFSGGGEGQVSSVSPFVSAQVLVPLENAGATGLPISFRTQLFLTEGVQIGIGPRLTVFGGVEEPVVGPGAFSLGAQVGSALRF